MAPSGRACDTRHFVCLSLGMVQIGIVETGGFYEVVADHRERPAASMMPSMTRRNTLGSSRGTNRLAMKAPDIKDAPATSPLSATSKLPGQAVLGHLKRDDDAFGTPVAGDRSAKLDRHATVEKLAAVSAFTSGSRDRWTAALGPDHHHF